MLATILLGVLIIECAFYAAIVWATLWLRLPLLAGATLCLALGLGYRARLIRQMFRLSERSAMARPPEAELDRWGYARLVIAEYLSLVLCYSVLHPFEPLLNRRDAPANATGTPILFIHGYVCNGGFWWRMKRALRHAGHTRLYTMNAEPIFNGIDDFGAQAARRIEDICAKTGEARVILIGHSMGGLIARCCVQQHGCAGRVAHIITLATPHQGTYAAHGELNLGEDSRQMRRDSPWLEALNAAPCPVPLTSIYTMHDNIVVPQDSSIVADAENIALAGIGHLEIAFSKPFHDAVVNALEGIPVTGSREALHAG